MEDMEMRIMASACDSYMYGKMQQLEEGHMHTPLESIISSHHSQPSGEDEHRDISSPIIVAKLFASIYERRVWKRRLFIITETMVLVMKRPSDHYLKNVIILKDMNPAVAVPFTEDVLTFGYLK